MAGFSGTKAAHIVGISYRQLDYWARTSLVLPTVRPATGSGTSRLYGFRDILELKIVKRLLDTGVSLQQIRTAVEHLRARGTTDLTQVTLMSDGVSVYECTSPDEVIDLLAGGQGVFKKDRHISFDVLTFSGRSLTRETLLRKPMSPSSLLWLISATKNRREKV